jgi:hypothetical protein
MAAAALAAVIALGDQRTVVVEAVSPRAGGQAPVTLRSVQLGFNIDVNRRAVEERFAIEPGVSGAFRWRGRAMEYVLARTLAPGRYTIRLESGPLGANGERLREPLSFSFEVRPAGLAIVHPAPAGGERLTFLRDGSPPIDILSAARIGDLRVAPDGSAVAVVTEDGREHTRLNLVDGQSGEVRTIVDDPSAEIGQVAWSADSQALLALRLERLPGGTLGVGRLWLVRLSGEFVARLDAQDRPTLSPSWSPDAQHVAYAAPAEGQLIVLNLSTGEETPVGQLRGGRADWSPDSRLIAFESVPAPEAEGGLIQPVRVYALDGSFARSFGQPGEIRSSPRFHDSETLVTLRDLPGNTSVGSELVFESAREGAVVRRILLGPAGERVTAWELDPSRTTVAYVVRGPEGFRLERLDLETGTREVVAVGALRFQWLP